MVDSSAHGISTGLSGKRFRLFLIAIFFVISMILSISLGAVDISPSNVIRGLFINDGSKVRQIIFNVRLHRTLTAAMVGACLALSGTILQGIMRNPLAGPGIIGVSSGAGLMAVIILILYPERTYLVPVFSFTGALLTTFLIYLLSWKGGVDPLRMVLSGIAVSSLLNAGMQSLFILFPSRVQNTIGFTVGGLQGTGWKNFYMILPYAVVGILLTFFFRRILNVLSLGDEVAGSLGINVELIRIILITLSSVLAGAAVSTVGLLSFVGLIGPHLARLIVGSDHKILVPSAMFLGGGLVMAADIIGRTIFRPMEIPVGIIMSLLGVPFFFYLLRQKKVA
ncbi:MAG TPA: iron ABC transporter permease [Clostridiales bacterium]|nr:iron ABC transporter permease [Clostridiales bacterium]